MTPQKKKFLIKGWVQETVWAEIEATSLAAAKRIVKKADGNGNPDEFSWNDGDWVSDVEVESIEEVKTNLR